MEKLSATGLPWDVTSLAYIHAYHAEISPTYLRFCALTSGVLLPDRPLRYLELGFGQGVSLSIHAASDPGEYWGNDINLAHVAHARSLAEAAGTPSKILPDSFEDLLRRSDLPQFDVLALHGIWSWISDEDRARVVELARRRLAPGGLLYVSYNCAAGWAGATAMRHLMIQHAAHERAEGVPQQRVVAAMEFVNELAATGAGYFQANPTLATQLAGLRGKDPTYLVHEFLGEHWRSMSLWEAVQHLRAADLDFVGSAFLLERNPDFSLNERGRRMYEATKDPLLREMIVEAFINPHFRADVFVKAPGTRMPAQERVAALRAQRFMLMAPANEALLSAPGPRGQVTLDPALYTGLISAWAANAHAPKALAEIADARPDIPFDDLVAATLVLVGARYLQPAHAKPSDAAREACARLNAHLCQIAVSSGAIPALASPVLGAGAAAGRATQLFLLARRQGVSGPKALADYVLELTPDDAARMGPALYDRLLSAAERFETTMLPILAAAEVV